MGRNCPIDFKLGTKVKYDNRNPLPVQEGRTDMISSIIHEFFQIWDGIVRLTSNLVGRSSMIQGMHYWSKQDVVTWSHSRVLSNIGRNCAIDFKLGRKVKYDTRNPLSVHEGRIDMISLIIREFCQILEGILRLTSNLVGSSSMIPGIHYR